PECGYHLFWQNSCFPVIDCFSSRQEPRNKELRMKQIIFAIIAYMVLATTVAQARDSYAGAIVPGDRNPTIEVVSLDDPSNPYRDSYTEMDRWAFNNFSRHMTDENRFHIQGTMSDMNEKLTDRGLDIEWISRRSVVELD